MTLQKREFNLLWEASSSQPWLAERSDVLSKILYDECVEDEERQLVLNLIKNFEYISPDRERDLLERLAKIIAEDVELPSDSTVVCGMAMDSESDSSDYVVYALKSLFATLPWQPALLLNRPNHILKKFKADDDLSTVVLVDEFLGSGQTLLNRLRSIRQSFQQSGRPEPTIKARFLAATIEGNQACSGECDDIVALIDLPKGISDYYCGEEKTRRTEQMLRLESCLSSIYKRTPLPSFGYGHSEALYFRYYGSVPNNVFPFFWWPKYADFTERDSLLKRAM